MCFALAVTLWARAREFEFRQMLVYFRTLTRQTVFGLGAAGALGLAVGRSGIFCGGFLKNENTINTQKAELTF
jgi:hypothetical protein